MTILSETTQKILSGVGIVCVIAGLILCIFSIVCVAAIGNNIAALVVVIAALVCMAGAAFSSEPHRKVKAIISDDYSAVELHDKYDVNERDGEIWVLTEKEPISKEDK